MIVITLNVNGGYDLATLNAKEICLFRKLIIMHIGQEAHTHTHIYIYIWIINIWRKCTFSSYILTFFHFSHYILILSLLVPKPINACYFRHFRQSTDGNS